MSRTALSCVAVCVCFMSTLVHAQSFWEPADGMPVLDVRAIASTGMDIYVSSGNADVWHSPDDGVTWMRRPLPAGSCANLAVSGGKVFAAARQAGLMVSTNRGVTWTPAAPSVTSVTSITIANDGRMYLGSDGTGCWVSTDQGVNWRTLPAVPVPSTIAVGPGDELYGCSSHAVIRSTDRGATWTEILNSTGLLMEVLCTPGGALLVRQNAHPMIKRSTDKGATWSDIRVSNRPNGDNSVVDIALDAQGNVYAGMMNGRMFEECEGIRRSGDEGASWSDAAEGLSHNGSELTSIISFGSRPDGTVFAGSRAQGLFRSGGGFIWSHADRILPSDFAWGNGFPPNSLPPALVAFEKGLLVAGTKGLGLFRSLDSGRTWNHLSSALPIPVVDGLVRASTRTVYALSHGNGIWRVDPLGATKAITPPFRNIGVLGITRRSDGRTFAMSANDSLYTSIDDGDSWTLVGGSPGQYGLVQLCSGGLGTLYAASDTCAYRSTDDGRTWRALGQPGEWQKARGVIAADAHDNLFWTSGWTMGTWGSAAYRVRAGDSVWVPSESSIMFASATAIASDARGQLFIGARNGISRSTDAGDTWTVLPGAFDYTSAIAAAPDGPLYVIGNGGALRASYMDLLDVEVDAWAEPDSLTVDPATGAYVPPVFTIHAVVRNQSLRRLDSLFIVMDGNAAGTVLDPIQQFAVTTLAPGMQSPDMRWRVSALPALKDGMVSFTCTARAKGLPQISGTAWIWIPAKGAPAFSGALTAEANPVPFDTVHWRSGLRPSTHGAYNTVRVDARIDVAGTAPARRVTATLLVPPGAVLEQGEIPAQLVSAAPLAVGTSDTVSWHLRLITFDRDTVLSLRVMVVDDSSGVRDTLSLALAVQGAPAKLRPLLTITTIPPDTLHYDPVLKDYEGTPSPVGTYTVFPLRVVVRNTGSFAALNVVMGARLGSEVLGDSIIVPVQNIATGDSLVWALPCHAIRDSVWRTVTLCADIRGVNVADTSICTQLVLEPFPRVTGIEPIAAAGEPALEVYPNPPRAATVITYTLAAASDVRLSIVDLLGRERGVLANAWNAAGAHSVQWDAASVPAGVYLCVLRAGARMQTRTIIVTHGAR